MPVPRFGQNLRLHQSPGCLPLFAGTLKNCDLPCAGMDCPDRVRASRVARERRVFWRGAMGKNQPGKLTALVWIAHRDSFVLKGALLFELWTKDRHRPTRDVDFLAYGPNDLERFIGIFREICSNVFAEDGLTFDVEAINGVTKEDADYEGLRLHFI